MDTPKTLLEAITYFSDPDRAREFVVRLRWPNGVACPRHGCGSASVQWIATRKLWRCKECKKQFTAKVGTVFEDSPIGFDKWLPAFWLLSGAKNGISSLELSRALGVTQKTAWFMLHRIRLAMQTKTFHHLVGEVESDETYIGGKRRPVFGPDGKIKRDGPRKDKAIVMGIIQRGGEARAFVIPDDKGKTLLPKIYEHVHPKASIYTDAHRGYWDLQYTHHHEFVNHMERYVDGNASTNHVENFWNCLKRMLGGTYISVRPPHLQAYVDEQLFRFNTRYMTDGPRFLKAVKASEDCRMTYRELTAKAKKR